MIIFLNQREKEKLLNARARKIETAKKRLSRKKLSHLNCSKLKAFYELIGEEIPEMFYLIRFKSSLSPYLYLYLKRKALMCSPADFIISNPIDVNINEICRVSKYSRNSVRKALDELENSMLLSRNTTKYHNSIRSYKLYNDYDSLTFKIKNNAAEH